MLGFIQAKSFSNYPTTLTEPKITVQIVLHLPIRCISMLLCTYRVFVGRVDGVQSSVENSELSGGRGSVHGLWGNQVMLCLE